MLSVAATIAMELTRSAAFTPHQACPWRQPHQHFSWRCCESALHRFDNVWVANLDMALAKSPVRSSLGRVAQTPGTVVTGAAVIVGHVEKLGDTSGFDVVNADGGIYSIQTTNPTRCTVIGMDCHWTGEGRKHGYCFCWFDRRYLCYQTRPIRLPSLGRSRRTKTR